MNLAKPWEGDWLDEGDDDGEMDDAAMTVLGME